MNKLQWVKLSNNFRFNVFVYVFKASEQSDSFLGVSFTKGGRI